MENGRMRKERRGRWPLAPLSSVGKEFVGIYQRLLSFLHAAIHDRDCLKCDISLLYGTPHQDIEVISFDTSKLANFSGHCIHSQGNLTSIAGICPLMECITGYRIATGNGKKGGYYTNELDRFHRSGVGDREYRVHNRLSEYNVYNNGLYFYRCQKNARG